MQAIGYLIKSVEKSRQENQGQEIRRGTTEDNGMDLLPK